MKFRWPWTKVEEQVASIRIKSELNGDCLEAMRNEVAVLRREIDRVETIASKPIEISHANFDAAIKLLDSRVDVLECKLSDVFDRMERIGNRVHTVETAGSIKQAIGVGRFKG